MSGRLIYAPEALADLDLTRRWLMQAGSGPKARITLAGLVVAIERLADNPGLYSFGPHPGVREMPCRGGFRVLYRATPDVGSGETFGDVRILRVFGPGQDRQAL